MASIILNALKRDLVGKKVQEVRENKLIPAVIYGQEAKNQNLSVVKKEFMLVFKQAGTSGLIDLNIDQAKPVKILIHDYQTDPISGDITHVDFYQLKAGQKITTEISLEFIGEAPAVKEFGGILMKNIDAIEVECTAKELEVMQTIKVDLTGLKALNDLIHIKDLPIPSGVKVLDELDNVVALVSAVEEEKVEEAPVVSAADVQQVGKEAKAEEGEEAEPEKTEK